LTLKYDEALSNFAFNFNIRCYMMGRSMDVVQRVLGDVLDLMHMAGGT
jgi:hypothetical protein